MHRKCLMGTKIWTGWDPDRLNWIAGGGIIEKSLAADIEEEDEVKEINGRYKEDRAF